MASDHGHWPWLGAMATAHGLGSWSRAMGKHVLQNKIAVSDQRSEQGLLLSEKTGPEIKSYPSRISVPSRGFSLWENLSRTLVGTMTAYFS